GGLHARAAQAVHGLAWDLDRKAGEQQRHARHVAVVLARLVGAAEDDVIDVFGLDASATDRLPEGDRRQVVWTHVLQLTAISPHRRARGGDDYRLRHADAPTQPPPVEGRDKSSLLGRALREE